jgi:hypothetical protein
MTSASSTALAVTSIAGDVVAQASTIAGINAMLASTTGALATVSTLASSTDASVASLTGNLSAANMTISSISALLASTTNTLALFANAIDVTNATTGVMKIDGLGNVGIGMSTSTLTANFELYAHTSATGTDIFRLYSDVGTEKKIKMRITTDGDIFTDGTINIGGAGDFAENYSAAEALDAGTVVAFATTTSTWSSKKGTATTTADTDDVYEISQVKKAVDGYDAVGVVSTKAALTIGSDVKNGVPIAFSGRIPVKATDENGAIQKGDYLTVSKTRPGYAMKLTGEGKSIGRALSDYQAGREKVMVLVENGYQKLAQDGTYASTTNMLTTGNVDLNANGVAITNIKALASANGTWSIDENGRIVAKALCLEDVCIDKSVLTKMLQNGQTVAIPALVGPVPVASTSTDSTATSTGQVSTASSTDPGVVGQVAATSTQSVLPGDTATTSVQSIVVPATSPQPAVQANPSVQTPVDPAATGPVGVETTVPTTPQI